MIKRWNHIFVKFSSKWNQLKIRNKNKNLYGQNKNSKNDP